MHLTHTTMIESDRLMQVKVIKITRRDLARDESVRLIK